MIFRLLVCGGVAAGPVDSWGSDFNLQGKELDLKPRLGGGPELASSINWKSFDSHVFHLEKLQRQEGIAYMISGALVLIGGGIGYANASDSMEKVAFSLSQSLAIGAIGYGFYTYKVGDSDRGFHQVLSDSPSLSELQRDELVGSYLRLRQRNSTANNWVRLITHSLVAGLNFAYATQEKDSDVRSALYFVGGINALAGFSLAF